MPVADMFVYSILDFWGMSQDLQWVYRPESQERYDWCIAQALKRRKDFIAVLETVVGAEQAEATKRPAPSITSTLASPPKQLADLERYPTSDFRVIPVSKIITRACLAPIFLDGMSEYHTIPHMFSNFEGGQTDTETPTGRGSKLYALNLLR